MIDHEQMLINYRDASSDTRMRDACLQDLERFYINGSWWKGSHGQQFKNKPKPEFNKLWRSVHRIVGSINNMELNAIIVSNSSDATDEGAELLQKRWRNDFQTSEGIEASEVATMEATVGGFGCTKQVCKFEDEEIPDSDDQYICTEIVHNACDSVYFDVASLKKDKSDSRWGWHIVRTNRKQIEEEYNVNVVSFSSTPYQDINLSSSNNKDVFLAHYYEVVEKTITEYDFSELNGLRITAGDGIKDEFGNKYTREDLKEFQTIYTEVTGELPPTKKRKVKRVEYALADGEKFLTKPQKTPFKRVPLYPRYGYYAVLNGEEFYCGELRKQTDAEMFHNYFGSTMMEIMAAPQVSKPEYTPAQIKKHAGQRSRADIDNVPFVMSDPLLDKDGNIAHLGPIGQQQPPQIGTGLSAAGNFLTQNIAEAGGMGQATLPAGASGEAIQQVNQRTDDAFLPIVKNVLHAIRAQCEGWIPAAQSLYFTNQRSLRIVESDGSYANITTLEMTQREDGAIGPFGNAAYGRYSVQVEQGEAYKTSRDAERDNSLQMLQYVGTDTEFGQLIAMNAMSLTNGEGGKDMRQIARYKMIDLMLMQQIPFEPKNDREAQYVQMRQQQMAQAAQTAAQQNQMMLEQAAMTEAQARTMEGQAQLIQAENKQVANQIDMFDAETRRAKVFGDLQIKDEKLNLDAIKTGSAALRKESLAS